MNLDIIWLLKGSVDFGLVVLIAMVQGIIYPSFKHYTRADLVRWHETYTKRIAIIVVPLMVSQVILSVVLLLRGIHIVSVGNAILVIAVWIATFLQFVPIHYRITANEHTNVDLDQLIQKNWLRVLLWSLILFLHFFSLYLD